MLNGYLNRDILLPCVHPVIYEGIHHGVWHGEPIEPQVYVLNVFCIQDSVVEVGVDKVTVVWEPAYCEDQDNQYEHSNYLGQEIDMCLWWDKR